MERELWLLCATLAFSFLYYLASLRRSAGGGGRRPPGPRPLPVIGNLLSLGGDLHHTLASLARAHGPVMSLKLGLTTAVVVSSPGAAREALTAHDRRLAARATPDVTRALGFAAESMIWMPSSDPLWRTLRAAAAGSFFSPRSLAAARGARERKVRDMVNYFRGRAGEEVCVRQALYALMLNFLSSVFFSVDVVDLGAAPEQGLRGLMTDLALVALKPNVSDLFPFLRPLDLQGLRRWTARRIAGVLSTLDGIIDGRLADAAAAGSTDKHGDLLDSLLELVSTGKLARRNVTTILFELFAAGSDTTSVTVEWAMSELLRNPSAMAKVRAEMESALAGKETIEEPDVASLPYLQAVVKETMRLHPAVPVLLPHLAVDDGVEIGGYAVPKGATVIFNAWAIMRDPAAWERPGEFSPERFLDGAAEVDFRGKDFEFIPFGSGRRMCPGLPMAERVVPFIVASLLRAFEWRLPDGVSAEELDVSERFSTANVLAVPLRAIPSVVA